MTKLYYTATSCGMSNFIAAVAAGVKIETEQVNLGTHRTAVGDVDFYTINPKGNVPTLVLDNGMILNENAATLQWIADQNPGSVAPEAGTADRYALQAALSYVSGEVHGAIGSLFNPTLEPAVKDFFMAKSHMKLKYVNDSLLAGKDFLVGGKASVADFYLYIVLSWCGYLAVDLTPYPVVTAYFERIKNLEAVQRAHTLAAGGPSST